jgi:hypothetical protein
MTPERYKDLSDAISAFGWMLTGLFGAVVVLGLVIVRDTTEILKELRRKR